MNQTPKRQRLCASGSSTSLSGAVRRTAQRRIRRVHSICASTAASSSATKVSVSVGRSDNVCSHPAVLTLYRGNRVLHEPRLCQLRFGPCPLHAVEASPASASFPSSFV